VGSVRAATIVLTVALLAHASACRGVSYVEGSGGGGGTSTTSSSSTSGCDDGCDDDNPCTDDACEDDACTHVPRVTPTALDDNPCTVDACNDDGELLRPFVTAGEPGRAEEGGCPDAGLCQTDGACGLSLYTRSFPVVDASEPWVRTALSLAWTGSNAPPPRDIVAAEHSYQVERLYVVTSTGAGYLRSAGTWSAPVQVDEVFPGLPATGITALVAWLPQAGNPETLLFLTGGTPRRYFYFDVTETGVAVGPTGELADDTTNPAAAPQGSVDASWAFAHQTAFLGTPSWVVFYQQHASDVFRLDGGDFTWTALGTDVDTSIWGEASLGGPASASVVAAYLEGGELHLVAP
jgi:hypothetical protein